MTKRPFLKRETALIVVTAVSLLLVIISVIYILVLQGTIDANDQARGSALRVKENELNEQVNYIDTICGEYRKLYGAYTDLSALNPTNGSGYALPGSAKGRVDECYQTQ